MLIAVNKMKSSEIDSRDFEVKWQDINIINAIPNLKIDRYDSILRSLGWRPENILNNDVDKIVIRVSGVVCAVDSFIIYVGGYSNEIEAYTYDQFDSNDVLSFVKTKLTELVKAKAAQIDVRRELAWNGLVDYFESRTGFETNDKNQLVYSHQMILNKNRTIDFPVITRLHSTIGFEKELPKVNQIDFQTNLDEAFGKQLAVTLNAYFIQQMAIASVYLADVETKNICYRYLNDQDATTGTSILYIGFEYEMPGSPMPIEIFLIVDQSAVDLNTGKLNKMSEIILRSV